MRRFLIAGVFLLASALLFAGGKSQDAQGGSTAPVALSYWDGNPNPSRTPYLEQMFRQYEAAHTRVRVEYIPVPQNQYVEKINLSIASKTVPDLGMMNTTYYSGFVAQNGLLKLDDIFSAWEDARQFDAATINAVRKLSLDGGLYMIPIRTSVGCLWYRIDRFKEHGLGVPATWDDFFDAIAKTTDIPKGQYGWVMRGGPGSYSQLLAMFFSYSGSREFFDPQGKTFLRDPAVLEILTRFAGVFGKYTSAGDVTNNYQMMVASFDSGVGNMIQHNLGSLDEHRKSLPAGSFGTILFPPSIKGYSVMVDGGSAGYAVFQGTKNQAASVELLKYLSNEENISLFDSVTGEFPLRLDVQKHDWVVGADHLKNIVPAMQSSDTVLVQIPTFLPEYSRIGTEIAEPGFQAVLLGKTKPADYLNEWATALEEAYKRYLANTGK
jgi:multiple sugar transport system substrate-binding protein